jgi:Na+/melibiose symporter-like transporter
MSRRIVLGTMIFMLISRAVIPSYSDIMYYFMINVLEFSKKTIALLALVAFTTAIFGSFVYNMLLKKLEFRLTMVLAHLTIGAAIMSAFLLVSRISKEVLGINDVLFSFFTDAALEILFVAFVFMPTLVVQTKIVPKNVEATVYSVFASLRNLAHDCISPFIGGIIANRFSVTRENFENIGWFYFISTIIHQFVPANML